ncbi:unnamed protein product [Trichobilharzia szidati]|nr:unnamed protein product [Trichobilharzia szidati]
MFNHLINHLIILLVLITYISIMYWTLNNNDVSYTKKKEICCKYKLDITEKGINNEIIVTHITHIQRLFPFESRNSIEYNNQKATTYMKNVYDYIIKQLCQFHKELNKTISRHECCRMNVDYNYCLNELNSLGSMPKVYSQKNSSTDQLPDTPSKYNLSRVYKHKYESMIYECEISQPN